jgi:hypothetical protein
MSPLASKLVNFNIIDILNLIIIEDDNDPYGIQFAGQNRR